MMEDVIPPVPERTRMEKLRLTLWVLFTTVWVVVVNKITSRKLWGEPRWLYTLRELNLMLRNGKSSNDLLKSASVKDLDGQLRQDLSKYIK